MSEGAQQLADRAALAAQIAQIKKALMGEANPKERECLITALVEVALLLAKLEPEASA